MIILRHLLLSAIVVRIGAPDVIELLLKLSLLFIKLFDGELEMLELLLLLRDCIAALLDTSPVRLLQGETCSTRD